MLLCALPPPQGPHRWSVNIGNLTGTTVTNNQGVLQLKHTTYMFFQRCPPIAAFTPFSSTSCREVDRGHELMTFALHRSLSKL